MSPLTYAVAAVVTDAADRVLLCQQSGGHRLWGLPGGKIRNAESPVHAVMRDVFEETGMDIKVVDLVGIYQLTGDGCGDDLPDVLIHVFRATSSAPDPIVNSPGRICALAWHDIEWLPHPMTATTRSALEDAAAGRSGVLREVVRDTEPETPDAVDLTVETVEPELVQL